MPAPEPLFFFYEGTEPSLYTPLTGVNLNKPTRYLKALIDNLPHYDPAGTAQAAVSDHNDDPDSHPALIAQVQLEADRASNAADLASVSAILYNTVNLGLAGTTDTELFAVKSDNPENFSDLYKNVAGVAVYQDKSTINYRVIEVLKQALFDTNIFSNEQPIQNNSGELFDFILMDEKGSSPFSVDNYGRIHVVNQIMEVTTDINFDYAITDEKDQVAVGVDKLGNIHSGGLSTENSDLPEPYNIVDSLGRLALSINRQGNLESNTYELVNTNDNIEFAITDRVGRAILLVMKNGRVVLPSLPKPEVQKEILPNYLTELNQIVLYGDGITLGVSSTPAINTTQTYTNKKFVGILNDLDYTADPSSYASFDDLVEDTLETPATSMSNRLVSLISTENGIDFNEHVQDWVVSIPSVDNLKLSEMEFNTDPWTGVSNVVDYGLINASALAKLITLQSMVLIHGRKDYQSATTYPSYAKSLRNILRGLRVESLKLTQGFDPKLFLVQVNSHRALAVNDPVIAYAQYDSQNDGCILVCPTYNLVYDATTKYTLTNKSTEILGNYLGIVLKKVLVDKVKWVPLKPINTIIQGANIELTFNVPHGKLVLDTTLVAATANNGFDLWTSAGVLQNIISSVTITGPNRLKISLTEDLPPNSYLTYGRGRNSDTANSGKTLGPRGNLRDTQGEVYFYTDIDTTLVELHNWCTVFKLKL